MKILLIVSTCLATCWAQSCDSSFGTFLNALKDGMTSSDSTARDLEVESRDDYIKLVHQCFAQSTSDANRCALTDDELKGDVYGETGPMRGCARCQQLVKNLRDKYMGSKEEVRKCFRQHFAQAIREELEPCIQGKISSGYSFKVPPIPDFDEKTFQNLDVVEANVDHHIMVNSRLDACKSVNPSKQANTAPCMDNGFPGIYSKHCVVAKGARAKIPSSCGGRFDEVKKATCQCMNDKRDDWHTRFAKIQDIVNNAQKASECGQKISDEVGAWLTKLQTALSDCMPKDASIAQGQKTSDLRTLIELGCGQVINGGVKKNELTVGFRFVRLFLDALNDRITIFCDKNCSF